MNYTQRPALPPVKKYRIVDGSSYFLCTIREIVQLANRSEPMAQITRQQHDAARRFLRESPEVYAALLELL